MRPKNEKDYVIVKNVILTYEKQFNFYKIFLAWQTVTSYLNAPEGSKYFFPVEVGILFLAPYSFGKKKVSLL